MEDMTAELELPGFRFHPTEEELLDFYLKNIIFGKRLKFDIIGLLNIYRYDPWALPGGCFVKFFLNITLLVVLFCSGSNLVFRMPV